MKETEKTVTNLEVALGHLAQPLQYPEVQHQRRQLALHSFRMSLKMATSSAKSQMLKEFAVASVAKG